MAGRRRRGAVAAAGALAASLTCAAAAAGIALALALASTAALSGCGPLASSPAAAAASSEKRTLGAAAHGGAGPAAGLGAPASDELPETARPLGYRLHLDVDPRSSSFRGEAVLDVELRAPSRRLELHAVALSIEHVELEAGGARWQPPRREQSASRLRLELGRPVAGRLLVRIRYRGATTADEQGLFRQDVAGTSYLYSQAQAQLARRILPCFDEPRHKVPWQVSISAPKEARLYANGALVSDEPLPGGRHRATFAPTPPMPSFLLAVAAGPFRVIELGAHGRARFPVRLVMPQELSGDPRLVEAILPRAITAVERWLDRPLPLGKLDLVTVPEFFGAMENPGLITMNADEMFGARDEPADPSLAASFARVLVHELAHQWFGNQVTPARWGDLWISEALATWVAQQPFPELPELDAAYARIGSQVAARLADSREPQALRRDALGPERMFDAIAYDKGAAILTMLARWLGEARLKQALRQLLEAHAGGSITTEALAAALGRIEPGAEAVTLAAALHPGVPEVQLALVCSAAARPLLRTSLAPGEGPLPLCVRFAGAAAGERGQLCHVVAGQTEIALPLGAGQCPAWVIGNDDLRGYYRMRWTADGDPRGALPPPAAQTRAERLGLGWILSSELGSGTGSMAGSMVVSGPLFATAFAELRRHASAPAEVSIEADLADLELMAALPRWLDDSELAAWDELVRRRAARLLRPRLLAASSELERARLARALEVLMDLPWPAALTDAARARLARQPAAERDWRLALRSGRPEVFAQLLARVAAPPPGEMAAARALAAMPASSISALFAALDGGALPWSSALPSLVELLSRRTAQRAVITELASRGEALGRALAPVELAALLEAGRGLCSTADAALLERLFSPLAARLAEAVPRRARLTEVLLQVRQCEEVRGSHHRVRRSYGI